MKWWSDGEHIQGETNARRASCAVGFFLRPTTSGSKVEDVISFVGACRTLDVCCSPGVQVGDNSLRSVLYCVQWMMM